MRPNRNKHLTNQRVKVLDRIKAQDPDLANQLSNLKLDWYRLKNSADGETADLYIYDEIVPNWMAEWFGGISAEGLIAALNEISASTINVRINSPGGDVFEAIAIYNTLVSHSSTINVYVDALAASAASIIAMAGDKITMMVGSQMMIHDALGIELGNAADMRAFADFLDKQSDNLASIYAAKGGGDTADWRALMLAETWMFAEEAVELGLADEIYSADQSEEEETQEDEDAETPEEQQQEEEEDTEKPVVPENEDESVDNLMNRRHVLVNRGFNYAGRKRAPAPTANNSLFSDKELDAFLANWPSNGRK